MAAELPLGKPLVDQSESSSVWKEKPGRVKSSVSSETCAAPAPIPRQSQWFMFHTIRNLSEPCPSCYERMAILQIASTARQIAQSLDPSMAVYGLTTMQDILNDADWQPRFMSELMADFAGLALLLATFGIYPVVSYSVSQRVREIGIRMALGAESSQLLSSIIGNTLKLTLAGTGIGLLCTVALARLLQGMLFGVQPTDASTKAGVTVLLMGVAIVACYVPAHRASRLDPLIALRDN